MVVTSKGCNRIQYQAMPVASALLRLWVNVKGWPGRCVVHIFNPSIQGAEAGYLCEFQASQDD